MTVHMIRVHTITTISRIRTNWPLWDMWAVWHPANLAVSVMIWSASMGIDALVIRRGRKTADGEKTAVSTGSCTGLTGPLSGPQKWAKSRSLADWQTPYPIRYTFHRQCRERRPRFAAIPSNILTTPLGDSHARPFLYLFITSTIKRQWQYTLAARNPQSIGRAVSRQSELDQLNLIYTTGGFPFDFSFSMIRNLWLYVLFSCVSLAYNQRWFQQNAENLGL